MNRLTSKYLKHFRHPSPYLCVYYLHTSLTNSQADPLNTPPLLITSTQELTLQNIQEIQEIECQSFKVLMFYSGIKLPRS